MSPKDLPPVRADLQRTEDILVQLIDNAHLYSPKDQPITISAESTGDFVTFSVADRGPGIDSSNKDSSSISSIAAGISATRCAAPAWDCRLPRLLLTAHGGSISVTSQLGSGSVFSFTLPVAPVG